MRFSKTEYGVILPIILFFLINFIFSGHTPQTISHFATAVTTFLIFAVMMVCAFNVVKHADSCLLMHSCWFISNYIHFLKFIFIYISYIIYILQESKETVENDNIIYEAHHIGDKYMRQNNKCDRS